MKHAMISQDPRINVLGEMWYEFARERHQEIKQRLVQESPWASVQYWGAVFADWVLTNKSPESIEFMIETDKKAEPKDRVFNPPGSV